MRSSSSVLQRQPGADAPPLQVVGGAVLVALLLTLPWLGPLSFPFRMLTTIVHELSHGLAALLTGGSFLRFQIAADGSGVAYTAGGWRWLIIPAGYLGSALFGAVLIRASSSVGFSRGLLAAVGVGLLLLSLRFGVPSIFGARPLGGLLTVASGTLLGAAFLWVARRAAALWSAFLVLVVALQSGLNAFGDIQTLIGLSTPGLQARTDAQSMADLTYLPAIVWALLWALVAAALLGWAVWRTWFRARR